MTGGLTSWTRLCLWEGMVAVGARFGWKARSEKVAGAMRTKAGSWRGSRGGQEKVRRGSWSEGSHTVKVTHSKHVRNTS
eukprot:8899781-Pyramimonas_sp.AAC.1